VQRPALDVAEHQAVIGPPRAHQQALGCLALAVLAQRSDGRRVELEIYTVAKDECHLWEDPSAPMFIRAEQPAAATLGVLLVVYSYFSYTMARYTNAVGKITGSGLIAPTF